jgi:uncharacterized caspase-like protein
MVLQNPLTRLKIYSSSLYDTQYDNIAATGFPMWDIQTALKRFIKARKVVVIADACHSGGVGHSFDIARRASRAILINPLNK